MAEDTKVKLGDKDCAVIVRDSTGEIEFLVSENLDKDSPTYIMMQLFVKLVEDEDALAAVMGIESSDPFDDPDAEEVWH